MSNAKGSGGHCLSDGTGRDSYAFLQQSTKPQRLKPPKWTSSRRIWRGTGGKFGGKPDEESSPDGPQLVEKGKKYDPFALNEVWIAETASDPIYVPTAKPYKYNCRNLTRVQRDHDVVRVKERASDIARRQADIERRLLRAQRLATCIPTVVFQKPPRLHRTFEPVVTAHNKRKDEENLIENRAHELIRVFPAANQIAKLPSRGDHGGSGERAGAQRPASSAAHVGEYSEKKRKSHRHHGHHEHHEKHRQRSASAVPSNRDRRTGVENQEPGLGARLSRREGAHPHSLTGRRSMNGHLNPISDNRGIEGPFIAPRDIKSCDPFFGPRLSRRAAMQVRKEGIRPYGQADPVWVKGGWSGAGDRSKFRSDGEGEWVWMQVTPHGGLRDPDLSPR